MNRFIGDEKEESNPEPNPEQMFTQDQLNSFLAKDRKRSEAALEASVADLETLRQQNTVLAESAALSEEQSTTFSQQLEEIRQRGLTDQQKHAENEAAQANRIKEAERKAEDNTKLWRGKYEDTLTKNALLAACAPNETHNGVQNPSHVTSFLQNQTFVNDEGEVLVKDFKVPSGESGEFETKDVTTGEAINIMSQTVSHRNLFNIRGKSGTNQSDGGDHDTPIDQDVDPNNLADVRKYMGLNPRK